MRWILAALLLMSACHSDAPQIREGENFVKQSLRDPDSAQFRNEKIRVVWSQNGDRWKVYCAEVNANNAFGGKTGFSPLYVTLDARSPSGGKYLPSKGDVIENDHNPNTYLNCERPDTERKDGELFLARVNLYESYEEMRSDVDQSSPVISTNSAPN